MKTYDQLTPEQQKAAHEKALDSLLNAVVEGAVRFSDELNHDDLQARIDAAVENADAMQTPWFVGEYIMDTCREELESMALTSAEDALYSEAEHVVSGIAA